MAWTADSDNMVCRAAGDPPSPVFLVYLCVRCLLPSASGFCKQISCRVLRGLASYPGLRLCLKSTVRCPSPRALSRQQDWCGTPERASEMSFLASPALLCSHPCLPSSLPLLSLLSMPTTGTPHVEQQTGLAPWKSSHFLLASPLAVHPSLGIFPEL